jgi:hypothetical protein
LFASSFITTRQQAQRTARGCRHSPAHVPANLPETYILDTDQFPVLSASFLCGDLLEPMSIPRCGRGRPVRQEHQALLQAVLQGQQSPLLSVVDCRRRSVGHTLQRWTTCRRLRVQGGDCTSGRQWPFPLARSSMRMAPSLQRWPAVHGQSGGRWWTTSLRSGPAPNRCARPVARKRLVVDICRAGLTPSAHMFPN